MISREQNLVNLTFFSPHYSNFFLGRDTTLDCLWPKFYKKARFCFVQSTLFLRTPWPRKAVKFPGKINYRRLTLTITDSRYQRD